MPTAQIERTILRKEKEIRSRRAFFAYFCETWLSNLSTSCTTPTLPKRTNFLRGRPTPFSVLRRNGFFSPSTQFFLLAITTVHPSFAVVLPVATKQRFCDTHTILSLTISLKPNGLNHSSEFPPDGKEQSKPYDFRFANLFCF